MKYKSVLDLGTKLNIADGDVTEENGILKLKVQQKQLSTIALR